MFTDEQLKQLRQLIEANNEVLRKEIREEVEAEGKITRNTGASERMHMAAQLAGIENRLKNVEIETVTTRKELKEEIYATKKEILARIVREAEDAAANFRATWEKMDAWHEGSQELQERVEHVEEKLGIAHQN